MAKLGYHISHEQFSPAALLQYVVKAEEAGFQFALSSDHFYPWSDVQGQSGFAWSWLGAALARTNFEMGVINCPYRRYNPAIIAQATATLLDMFPDRFWLGSGSGQMLNEGIVGQPWPIKEERNAALKDAVNVMRQLWAGEEVSYSGHFEVREAKLYTRPPKQPVVVAAAITPATAEFVSSWADALITVIQPMDKLEKMVKVWRNAVGNDKPMHIKIQVSYDPDPNKAKQLAFEQWKTNIFGSDMLAQLRTPKQFEQAAAHVSPDDLEPHVHIGNDPDMFIKKIKEYEELGFEKISIHNVNVNQESFIHFFSQNVLPEFK